MITFTAFYIDLPENTPQGLDKPVPVLAERPHEQLRTMFQSVQLFHPTARLVVLTDLFTNFDGLPYVEVVRTTIDPLRLMEGRMKAWFEFLEKAQSHVVFLDSDILLQADLSSLFCQDFDLGLTYRFQEQWPINAGVQFFHGDHLVQGREFMSECINLYRTRYTEYGFWGGDQDVLRDMVKGADCSRQDSFLFMLNDFRILMLPCDMYNYSSEDAKMDGYYPEKKVLHFKGQRKVFMETYWRIHLAS